MKKLGSVAVTVFIVIGLTMPPALAQNSGDTDVSVSVDRVCSTSAYNYRFNGATFSDDLQTEIVGLNTTGNFEYTPVNQGEMSFSNFNISIYRTSEIEAELDDGNETEEDTNGNETEDDNGDTESSSIEVQDVNETDREYIDLSDQPSNYSKNYLMNSTNSNTRQDLTLLFPDNENETENKHYVRPFRHNTTEEIRESHQNADLIGYNSSWEPLIHVPRMPTFNANYNPGEYTAELDMTYRCEFSPREASTFNVEGFNESFNRPEFDDLIEEEDIDISNDVSIDGLNVSDYDNSQSLYYAVTHEEDRMLETDFAILDLEGEGVIPDDVGEDDEVDQEVETDAEEPDEADTEFDVDADEPLDEADEREGDDSEFPGETEVPDPQPEPDPDPQPLLSLSIMPLNSTYEAPRGRFTEIGLEVENIGLETVNNLELEPRFSEAMDWEAQIGNIDSLDVDESVNSSVYVNPSESVDPGLYQVPVYGSNPEGDIALQYVNVEVTEDIFQGVLNIEEAPRDVRFEQGGNYTLPLILSNNGETEVENVQIELNNYEACGTYSVDPIDNIEPGSDVSATIQFQAGNDLEECSATIIASSDSGDLAFSELNIDVREEIGFVPEEFRVPIVASLWTLMLLAYAILTKKYGVHNMTVKVPLVLLVVGEAFIIIYLSSTYYNLAPPGLLPF